MTNRSWKRVQIAVLIPTNVVAWTVLASLLGIVSLIGLLATVVGVVVFTAMVMVGGILYWRAVYDD